MCGFAPASLPVFKIGAAAFLFYALVSLLTGFVWYRFRRIYRDENPYQYWSMVMMQLFMVAFCSYPIFFCGD
jgi:hypothetical protein